MDYNTRIDIIRDKLNINNISNNKINKYFNSVNITDSNIQDRITKITELAYCNDWNRLHLIHKRIKLEEFINGLNNYTNLDEIKEQLIELLNNKKILKKHVIYDKINGKLLDILILERDNTLLKIK